MKLGLALAAVLALGAEATQGSIDLPAPRKTGGQPLMETLALRATSRTFDTRKLPLEQGAFVYDAAKHRLVPALTEDIRALGGSQDFVRDAPVTLVFVADLAKMGDGNAAEKEAMAAFDTGFISQNVYLYCASEGLATGIRAMLDRDALGKRLRLRPDQRITGAQSIGYPKK